ncbi:hypothetical protein E2C01_060717 [Portunus trituberculatus]|uniref:Uncharacterized protein n=1 Tax=Portunus trituberculatus TaxID=210409 RepID=A0A5B7HC86_PORTR|nr:hypothetical protein [Portunus trituberculatus]
MANTRQTRHITAPNATPPHPTPRHATPRHAKHCHSSLTHPVPPSAFPPLALFPFLPLPRSLNSPPQPLFDRVCAPCGPIHPTFPFLLASHPACPCRFPPCRVL